MARQPFIGELIKDSDGDTWEIWSDRAQDRDHCIFKSFGRWYYRRPNAAMPVGIRDAPRFARVIVTEIERRWPPVDTPVDDEEESTMLPITSSICVDPALVPVNQADVELVAALKSTQRQLKRWQAAALVSSALGAINGILLFLAYACM
jgi:hypothetical protein